MKKRKIAALLMAAVVVMSTLAGCGDGSGSGGGNEGAGNTEAQGSAGSGNNEEITNIVVEMINYGYDDPDLQIVEDAINEITEAEIAVHVDFMTVPIADMATKLGLLVAGGEEIDLVCTGLLTSPSRLVADGLLQPITDYINSSEVLLSKAGDMLDACMVGGEIYAYPGTLYAATSYAWYYDKDLAEQYNIEIPEVINSQEELTAIFEQVKNSGMSAYAISLGDGVGGERSYGNPFDGLGDSMSASYGVVLDKFNGTEVVDWYETEEYREQSKLHQEWFEKGYTVPDSISNGYTTTDSMLQGQCFSFVAEYSSGITEAYFSGGTGKNIGKVMMSDIAIETNGVIGTSWGIPSSSTKAEAAIRFVELIYSNTELATLYYHGIEGMHYVTTEGSRVIDYPEGVDASTCGYGSFIQMFGDTMELPVRSPLTEEQYTVLESLSVETAQSSKFLGYIFDPSKVSSQVAAVSAVITQYAPALNCGVDDVDTILPQFIDNLKAAGIDEIIAENQAQLDAWLSEQ